MKLVSYFSFYEQSDFPAFRNEVDTLFVPSFTGYTPLGYLCVFRTLHYGWQVLPAFTLDNQVLLTKFNRAFRLLLLFFIILGQRYILIPKSFRTRHTLL